jgi:hypothetical protein
MMEEDPKDVALALLLGWQRNETYGSTVWWRYCDYVDYYKEPAGLRTINRSNFCMVQPTAARCVARDTKQQITPEVTS